jgi:hypothetical protein
MLNPSDIVVRPESLTERLAAEIPAQAPALPEPTPTIMAERFAPEGQKAPAEGPSRPPVEPPAMPGLIPQQAGATSASRWLLVASIFVSLVPTAAILALLWQGMIALPGTGNPPMVLDYDRLADSQLASVGTVPVIAAPAAVEIAVNPDIVLTAPGRLEAKPGDEIDFDVAIDSADTLPARSVIAIRALPEGAVLSQGRPYADAEWNLGPDEIGDLRLKLPTTAAGSSDLHVELVAADGSVLASAKTRLDIAPDPRAELILRAEDRCRLFRRRAGLFPARGGGGQRRGGAQARRHLRSGVHRSDRRAGHQGRPPGGARLVRAGQAARRRGRRREAQGPPGGLDHSRRAFPGDRS